MTVLLRNATWSGAATAVRAVSGLINALLAVRLLGVEAYGHVATALSVFVLYLSLNSSVFTVLVSQIMAPGGNDRTGTGTADAERSGLYAAAATFATASTVLLMTATLILIELITRWGLFQVSDGGLVGRFGMTLFAMSLFTACQILVAFHSAVIESVGRLDAAMKAQLGGPLAVLGILAVMLTLDIRIDSAHYVAVLCAGAVVDLSILALVKRRVAPLSSRSQPGVRRWAPMTALVKSGGMLQAASLMSLFLEPLNKVLLNYFSGPQVVTTYDLAMKIIWGIQSLFGAAMRVFLQLSGQSGPVLWRAYSRTLALVGVPVLASHTASAIFLSWLAHHWIAVDSRQLMTFFVFATLSNLGMIYVTPLYVSLIGRGDMGFLLRSQTILATTNVAVSSAFVPILGLIGAAFGLLCATAYNVAAIYRRHSRISGAPEGIDAALAAIAQRYALTIALFAAAIALGLQDPAEPFLQVGVLGALVAIMVREPLVRMLAERAWRRI